MNEVTRIARQRATTQAAEGTPRLKWSLEEFDRLGERGVFTEQDHFELIGGELVPMSPKGVRHKTVRDELMNLMMRRLPNTVRMSSEIGWRPDATAYLEPDLILYPIGQAGVSVPATEVLLVIEVAATSPAFDTGLKAKTYAALGVREYWVVDAVSLATRVFLEPSPQGFGREARFAQDKTVTPQLIPALAVRIDDLNIPRT
jgi:Uma2 family endonuclease